MSQEAFKPLRTWDTHSKRHLQFQVVECSRCGKFENIPITSSTVLPPDAIVKKMLAKGWVMGHRRRDDICPECVAAKRKTSVTKIADYLRNEAPHLLPVEAKPAAHKEDAPGGEEKRIVILEIEKHYSDQDKQYVDGWTDKKIAVELGVPESLVRYIREFFFGPAQDLELVVLKKEIDTLSQQVQALSERLQRKMGDV
jgi:hypothetical protein